MPSPTASMTPKDRDVFIENIKRHNALLKAKLAMASAFEHFYDTTHGNEFGHDHHCPHFKFTGSSVPVTGCTCGWSLFAEKYVAYVALRDNAPA